MKRTARVARTAYDLTHQNRLGIPQFGVVQLYLTVGAKVSKSYLPESALPQKAVPKSSDKFWFAPEKETPKIKWKIDDPFGCITKATLELFHRSNATAIWKKDLDAADFTHGEHALEWNGKIPKATDFPEEFITVEHSPYKLRLSVEGEGFNHSAAAWTYLHVLVHELELLLGDKDVLSRDIDKAVYDRVGALPAKDAKAATKVPLVSNDFSIGADKSDGTLHTRYKTLWTDGPNIPVFVKAYIRHSSDAKEDVPKALGQVKFLWEWEDVPEDKSRLKKKAKEFVELAIDYEKATTKPKGDNCHKDRGGKRGDTAAHVFPAQGGYAEADALTAGSFPFKVEACTKRTWSSYSYSWRSGLLKGKSGVMFQPARMAGDGYKLHVYFPHNRLPDGKDELDVADDKELKHAITQNTGKFEIWREVHIISYSKKAGLTDLNLGVANKYYAPVFMDLVDKTGGVKTTIAGWDATIRARTNTQSTLRKAAVMDGDQGTLSEAALQFRSHADFKTKYRATKAVWGATEFDDDLVAAGADTVAGYKNLCEAIADACVPKACSPLLVDNGISIIHFNRYWVTTDGLRSSTLGFASTDFTGLTHSKCGYLEVGNYAGFRINGIDKTTGHEIGHTLYLPHAYDAGGYDNALHDEDSHWHFCVMSYNDDKENYFCGYCALRLRGWVHTDLKSNRRLNKK